MTFSFVFLLLLDFPDLNRQQKIEEFQHILLSLTFPSFYNNHKKSCCKLYPNNCFKLMDSTGYACELLRGRVTITENDGWIEFKISNMRFVDAGFYRCFVLDTYIYTDYYIEVTESSIHRSSSQPLLSTTMKSLSTSTSPRPDSTGPVLSQDHSDSHSVVCYRAKTKREQPDKCGETSCESQKQDALETNSVVYSTVDFRAHQESTEVYANVRIPKTRAGALDPAALTEAVEYSTLAIHQ
nr:PREDICTED: uncharacterized protein LOC109630828 isoform X2 [Paralichthys olivaceus]